MRRRTFIKAIAGTAVAWPLAARAQRPSMSVIGFIHSGSPGPIASLVTAFLRGLAEAGFVEGRNVAIEYRWAEDQFDRLPALASDLVRRNPSLIFVGGGDIAALAAKSATSTIPIVFAIGADPVRQGIVASLNRPGGNITGVSFLAVELRPKMLDLIRELVPNIATIAVLGNPNRPSYARLVNEVLGPARAIGLRVHVLKAAGAREIDTAFSTLKQLRVDALLILSDPVYLNRRDQIARLEMSHKVPAIHSSLQSVSAGGLIGYGADIGDAYRQAGIYSGRILKGEKPADLPVMQPTTFKLAINLKTAKAIGIDVPPTLLARADEIIE